MTLDIEPFHTVGAASYGWTPALFAESLAMRLRYVPNLDARVVGSGARPTADFLLSGDITVRDRRLVITTRLSRSHMSEPVWTSTFWRSLGPIPTVVEDVAVGVGEAVTAEIARRAVTTGGKS